MCKSAVTIKIQDENLPSLAHACTPETIHPRLIEVLADAAYASTSSCCSVEVLKHWPGKRCTLRYELTNKHPHAEDPTILIGKLYRRPDLAAQVHRTTMSLHADLAQDGFSAMPKPLALLPDLGLTLQQYVPGELLSALKPPLLDIRPFDLAGRWLARLHDTVPVAGLRERSLGNELQKIEENSEVLQLHVPQSVRKQVGETASLLRELVENWTQSRLAMTHRDFYPGNVLWDGARIRVIDFDWLSMGDPVLDVGCFLAQLEKLSQRATGRWDAYATCAEAFRCGYLEASQGTPMDRLPFSVAATFLNLAADEVRRQRYSGWRDRAVALAARSRQVVHAAGWD